MTLVLTSADLDNVASQRTLDHPGFTRVRTDETYHFQELELPAAFC